MAQASLSRVLGIGVSKARETGAQKGANDWQKNPDVAGIPYDSCPNKGDLHVHPQNTIVIYSPDYGDPQKGTEKPP